MDDPSQASIVLTPDDYEASQRETLIHMQQVRTCMGDIISLLNARANTHDFSKLHEPERSGYARLHLRMQGVTYGSPAYRDALQAEWDTIAHHYAMNDHHLAHHPHGARTMSLFMLLEMLADWKAASQRGSTMDGAALQVNPQGLSDELISILTVTIEELGW